METEEQNNNLKTLRCCIPNCRNSLVDKQRKKDVAFYTFPDQSSDLITYRCWLREVRKCKAEAGETFKDTQSAFVCECHFRRDDFSIDLKSGNKVLREGSVPLLMAEYSNDSGSDVEVVETSPTIKLGNRLYDRDIAEEQKKLRDYQLSLLHERIGQQKDLSRQRLYQEKEEQEKKLQELLLEQEKHKRQVQLKAQQQQEYKDSVESQAYRDELNRMRQIKQLKELEEQQRRLQEVQSKFKEKKNTKNATQVKDSNGQTQWKKKKENLQQMLEQQKERLAEIQKQESLYEAKKRKRVIDSSDDRIKETSATTSKNMSPSNSINVISCGKCLKLESELRLISQQYLELKKENEYLKMKLNKK